MRRIVSTLIVLSMLAVPTILLAQEAGDACVRAQLDGLLCVPTFGIALFWL